MNTPFQIRVDERHVIENEPGYGLMLRTTDDGHIGAGLRQLPYREWPIQTPYRITTALTYLGLDFGSCRDLAEGHRCIINRVNELRARAEREPDRGFVAIYANGNIKLRWTPGGETAVGDWTLVKPAVLPEEQGGGANVTSHVLDPLITLAKHLEDAFIAAGGVHELRDLDPAFAKFADSMTADVRIIEGEAV